MRIWCIVVNKSNGNFHCICWAYAKLKDTKKIRARIICLVYQCVSCGMLKFCVSRTKNHFPIYKPHRHCINKTNRVKKTYSQRKEKINSRYCCDIYRSWCVKSNRAANRSVKFRWMRTHVIASYDFGRKCVCVYI